MSRGVPIFDQRGQTVMYQYNSAGNINVGPVVNKGDFALQLANIRSEIEKAAAAKVVDARQSTEARYNLEMAQNKVSESKPNKSVVQNYLTQAKEAVQGLSATAGLVEAINQCIDNVTKLF